MFYHIRSMDVVRGFVRAQASRAEKLRINYNFLTGVSLSAYCDFHIQGVSAGHQLGYVLLLPTSCANTNENFQLYITDLTTCWRTQKTFRICFEDGSRVLTFVSHPTELTWNVAFSNQVHHYIHDYRSFKTRIASRAVLGHGPLYTVYTLQLSMSKDTRKHRQLRQTDGLTPIQIWSEFKYK